MLVDPIHQSIHSCHVVSSTERPRFDVGLALAFDSKDRLWLSNPIDAAFHNPFRNAVVEQRELDARRATIDRQDAGIRGFAEAHGTGVVRVDVNVLGLLCSARDRCDSSAQEHRSG